jgi:hypothetical protein
VARLSKPLLDKLEDMPEPMLFPPLTLMDKLEDAVAAAADIRREDTLACLILLDILLTMVKEREQVVSLFRRGLDKPEETLLVMPCKMLTLLLSPHWRRLRVWLEVAVVAVAEREREETQTRFLVKHTTD